MKCLFDCAFVWILTHGSFSWGKARHFPSHQSSTALVSSLFHWLCSVMFSFMLVNGTCFCICPLFVHVGSLVLCQHFKPFNSWPHVVAQTTFISHHPLCDMLCLQISLVSAQTTLLSPWKGACVRIAMLLLQTSVAFSPIAQLVPPNVSGFIHSASSPTMYGFPLVFWPQARFDEESCSSQLDLYLPHLKAPRLSLASGVPGNRYGPFEGPRTAGLPLLVPQVEWQASP